MALKKSQKSPILVTFTISVKTVFSAVKDAKFSVSYVKGVPYFVRRWYTKRVSFLSKTAYRRDSPAQPP